MYLLRILTRFNRDVVLLTALLCFEFHVQSQFNGRTELSDYVRLLDTWHDPSITPNGLGVRYNDTWGFVQNGKEYAVIGSTLGTHIFLIGDNHKLNPIAFVAGANSGGTVIHRDFKDYNGYLYAVCDQGASTLQIIDLHYLPDSVSVVFDSPIFSPTTHNIFIDKEYALLYMCAPPAPVGMKVVSIANPSQPVLLYDFMDVPVVHDVYVRNNIAYLNCGNNDGLRIYDFSDPSSPVLLGALTNYPEKGYNHSGWLNEKGNTYVFTDENEGAKIKVCDVSNPADIQVVSLFNSGSGPNAMAHNVMIKNDLVYVSHYKDGLQIFDIRNPARPQRVGFYETYPVKGSELYNGAWGIYSLLPSGRILVSDMSAGLFLLGFDDLPAVENVEHGVYPNPASDLAYFHAYHPAHPEYNLYIYNSIGQLVQTHEKQNRDYTIIYLDKFTSGMYFYRYESTKTGVIASGKFQVIKQQ